MPVTDSFTSIPKYTLPSATMGDDRTSLRSLVNEHRPGGWFSASTQPVPAANRQTFAPGARVERIDGLAGADDDELPALDLLDVW